MYKRIPELLLFFLYTFFSHLLTDSYPVQMLRENGSTEALCVLGEHVTVVLD